MHLESLPFAAINFFGAGTGLAPVTGAIIAVSAILIGGIIAICGMYFHHRQREMWHATARVALEKGQPLPPLPDAEEASADKTDAKEGNHDIRGGMVLIAVGAGLWLMLGGFAPNLRYVGAIPGLIGVALLLYAALAALFRRKQPTSDSLPPRT